MALELQDYTTFTEVDPSNYISISSATYFSDNEQNNKIMYLYKDMGSDIFINGFKLRQRFKISSTAYYTMIFPLLVAGGLGDNTTITDPQSYIRLYSGNTNQNLEWRVVSNGVSTAGAIRINTGVNYYYELEYNLSTNEITGRVLDASLGFVEEKIVEATVNPVIFGRYLYAANGRSSGSNAMAANGSSLWMEISDPPASVLNNPLFFAQD